ncbi:MAG: SpoIIE family protein phosphatase [Bacteroidia bacterium]|nr:SpoIIE family protein phosphatase [Bacteroidia bacterium]
MSQKSFQPAFYNLDPEIFQAKNVRLIKKDNKNGFWLLADRGLGHYNGYYTRYYSYKENDKNSPLNKNLQNLFIAKNGVVWFGYANESAISCFDPETEKFTHYKSDSAKSGTFPHQGVLSEFYEDSQGRFWISTWGGGLALLNRKTGQFEQYLADEKRPKANGIPFNTVRGILEIEKDKFLVTFFEEKPKALPVIFDAAKKTFTPFQIEDCFKNLDKEMAETIKHCLTLAHYVYRDKSGVFWFGTYSGLICIDPNNKTAARISGKAFDNKFTSLENTRDYIIDDHNNLWTNTVNSGIMIVNLETKKAFYHKQLFNCETCVGSNLIGSFTKDNEDNIWVNHGNGGVSVYYPLRQEFRVKLWADLNLDFTNPSHQSIPVNQMLLRGKDKLYISNANGIAVYNYKTDSLLKPIQSSKKKALGGREKHILSFKIFNNNLFYQAITNELVPHVVKQNLKTREETSFKEDTLINSIFFYTDSLLPPMGIFGSTDNYKVYNEQLNKFEKLYIPEKSTAAEPYYSEILKNGKYFFGCGTRGFFTFDPRSKKSMKYSSEKQRDKPFADSTINAYYYDKTSTVWIACSNGIYSFDENTEEIKNWNNEIGINNLSILQIATDAKKDLWFASSKDLFNFNFKTKNLYKYTKDLGLNGDGFNHKRALAYIPVADDGNIFFATIKGLLMVNPSKLQVPQTAPRLSIYNVSINDSALSKNELNDFLNSNINLNWDKNFITFELNTNQVFTPTPNKFYYKLIGLEDKWIDNGPSNKIRFANLNDGTYQLQVKCINSYNIESEILTQKFVITQPFWKTWWFILLCILALFGAMILVIKHREKASELRKLQLEDTIKERTKEIMLQKEVIEEKQKELTDSIKYAQRIQNALLASKSILDKHLKNYFIYFNPKDIVSGDFYWATSMHDKFYLIIADSTGHGVPGAFMSLLNINFLNEAINEKNIQQPNLILDHVRQRLVQNLAEDGSAEGGKDGMDCSLLCFDFKAKILEFACANNPVLIVRKGVAIEPESDRMPVGKSPKETTPFTNHKFSLESGDVIYALTDGYADQFGGENGKKLKYKYLKQLILDNNHLGLSEQQQVLMNNFVAWKRDNEQVDDVCIAGIKII